MSWSDRRLSKFISLLLRHRPEEVGLELEPGGWVRIHELVERARDEADAPLSRDRLLELVEEQDKPRFSFSDDGRRIRANYGHSVDVDLDLDPRAPPATLYHGTAADRVDAILHQGLVPGSRRYVHLSTETAEARTVGRRHGEPRILRVNAATMHADGHALYRAAEGIWLTLRVPPRYLEERPG